MKRGSGAMGSLDGEVYFFYYDAAGKIKHQRKRGY